MNIITAIPCHNSDCIRAERLIDQIFALNRKEQKGCSLLVFAPSTPQENRDKVRISAEVAFKQVIILNAAIPKEIENKASVSSSNAPIVANLMSQVADYIAKHCKAPWLWLEPDSLPVKSGWMEKIVATYETQPMRYMASHLKQKDGDKEFFFISRMGVYPNDAAKDFKEAAQLGATTESFVFGMSSKCRLFQQIVLQSVHDISKLRPDVVLAHSDKRAELVDVIVEREKPLVIDCPVVGDAPNQPLALQPESVEAAPEPKRRGRPPTVKTPEMATV